MKFAEALAQMGARVEMGPNWMESRAPQGSLVAVCLLYTSDAADERSSVDLGGRRIIKKKKKVRLCGGGIGE